MLLSLAGYKVGSADVTRNEEVPAFDGPDQIEVFDGIRAYHSSICGTIDGLGIRGPPGTNTPAVGLTGVKREVIQNLIPSLLFLLTLL